MLSLRPVWWATALLGALLAISPLPYGSVGGSASLALRCGLALALALAVIRRRSDVSVGSSAVISRPTISRPMRAVLLCVAGLASLAVLQGLWPGLSATPDLSLDAALGWLTVLAALLAGTLVSRSAPRRRVLLAGLGIAAIFEVMYGLRAWLAGSMAIWGEAVRGPGGRLRGTFVNPDHAALWLEVAVVTSFAVCCWAVQRWRDPVRLEVRVTRVAMPGVLGGVCFLGLALTGSRAGLLAVLVGLLAQVTVVVRGRRGGSWIALIGALGAAGLIAAMARTTLFHRLSMTSFLEVIEGPRAQVWEGTLRLWRQAPIFGHGFGSFDSMLPTVVQSGQVGIRWNHAHNDWFELLATAGVVGGLLVATAMWTALRTLAGGARAAAGREAGAACLAALGAVVAIAVHEGFDFGLLVPANAVLLAVLVGAGLRAAETRN